MIMFNALSVLVPVLLLAGAVRAFRRPSLAMALCAPDGDEDVKIAGGDFSKPSSPDDSAEAAAREFLRQKSLGNIEKARGLGLSYAEALVDVYSRPVPSLTQQEIHHRLLLASYVVNRVIAERSPNSILAQTSLSVFYNEVEARNKVLYQHISDTAAFSLYILSERSGNGDGEICKIYARLCGFAGAQEKIAQADGFYRDFYSRCVKMIAQTDYSRL